MTTIQTPPNDTFPPGFGRAIADLHTATTRPGVQLSSIPAPKRAAPYGAAFVADIDHKNAEATGRFIVLHDPAGRDDWAGTTRIVTLLTADADAELARDECLAHVAWSWVEEALDVHGATHDALGGTVTRTYNNAFGDIDRSDDDDVQLELRVSWTPTTPGLAVHLEAWADALCVVAGLPPMPPGVHALHPRT